jgi:hypothetical protein
MRRESELREREIESKERDIYRKVEGEDHV